MNRMWSRAYRLARLGAGSPARWFPAGHPGDVTSMIGGVGAYLAPSSAPELSGTEPDGPDTSALVEDAHARGRSEGQREAERQLATERDRLAQTIACVSGLRQRVLAEAERDVAQLAVGMARRILHREVQLDPDILLAMARVALGRLGDRVAATVHLHPADHIALSGRCSEGTLVLASDPDLLRGGCRVSSASGEIDLGIDAQVTELARLLMDDGTGPEGVGHVPHD